MLCVSIRGVVEIVMVGAMRLMNRRLKLYHQYMTNILANVLALGSFCNASRRDLSRFVQCKLA